MDKIEIENRLKIYYRLIELKRIIRKGWQQKQIKNPESVADHTFGVLVLSLLFGKSTKYNFERLLLTALIHDFGESIIGDITPDDNISKEEKYVLEKNAMIKIFAELNDSCDVIKLWEDCNNRTTNEGRFIAELDKLEMILQAKQYENEQEISFDDYCQGAKNTIKDNLLKDIISLIHSNKHLVQTQQIPDNQ